jgi:phage FluMu gp28-like protein
LKASESELHFWKRALERVDPVVWLASWLGFVPWDHQIAFLRDAFVRTRVVRKSRQVGMTTAIALEALWKAVNIPKRMILIVSPGLRQSLIPLDKIHSIIDQNPSLKSSVISATRDGLEFVNGSSIIALPNNPARIRGYAATDIYLDEAAHFLNDEPVMQVLRPMLMAKRGTFTVVSTPFGKRGLFWKQYQAAIETKDSDVRAYEFHPSTLNPVVTEESLARDHADLTELEFRQEYLGEFIEEADTVFPLDLIAPCVNNELELLEKGEPQKIYYMGVDLAKQRDDSVVVVLEKFEKTGELIVRHITAWSKMNYTEQIGRIKQLSDAFPADHVAIDQTGVGEAVLENLKEALPRVEGVTFTQQVKLKLVDQLRITLEQKKLVLPNDSKLIMQMNSLRYTFTTTGNIVYYVPESDSAHDDYLWALALAVYAAQKPKPIFKLAGAKRNW